MLQGRRKLSIEGEDERGTVEAGLVIIPTTLLFLMILQIIFAGSIQIMERAKLHHLVIESSLAQGANRSNGIPNANKDLYSDVNENASYAKNRIRALAEDSLSPNSRLNIENRATNEGQLHRIELITPVPIFSGIFNFLGINEIGVRNVAVLIDE